jgi:hypothetical protein
VKICTSKFLLCIYSRGVGSDGNDDFLQSYSPVRRIRVASDLKRLASIKVLGIANKWQNEMSIFPKEDYNMCKQIKLVWEVRSPHGPRLVKSKLTPNGLSAFEIPSSRNLL